ncbi:MAG: DNA-protecting protein DprA [Chloroflexi bacterium]|nr:DNA-protecting protein DprA [Chloroflexota bacterium]
MDNIAYWVAFSRVPGVGRVRLSQLEDYFGDLEKAWNASAGELRQAGLDARTIGSVEAVRARLVLEKELELLEKYQVRVLVHREPTYPSRLKEIYDYPPVIYVRGELRPSDESCVAVVGTRKATMYGKQVADDMAAGLARSGITVVSGLARGIDTIAHRSAIDAGGRTIAVFASGLDAVYPAENTALAKDILNHGALISEYPVGVRPKAENFPRRNRILSGMSLGVLVVEAGEDSGAMITALQANEQNREVFAVPGSILSPASMGTNRLIQEGARLVRDYRDILAELNLTIAAEQLEMKDVLVTSEAESKLLAHVSVEPIHVDDICRKSGLPTPAVSSTLAIMELKGLVRQIGGNNYVLAKR